MMFAAGAGGGGAIARVGILKEALLRNARFLAAIGLHTSGMTADQTTKLFEENGFVDAANARPQAVRDTFAPTDVAHDLGEPMIRNLRAGSRAIRAWARSTSTTRSCRTGARPFRSSAR